MLIVSLNKGKVLTFPANGRFYSLMGNSSELSSCSPREAGVGLAFLGGSHTAGWLQGFKNVPWVVKLGCRAEKRLLTGFASQIEFTSGKF